MNYYKMALQKYAVFNGRSRRTEYWYFVLFNTIIIFILGFIDRVMGFGNAESLGILGGLYALALIIPSIAIAVRRLHDIGKSGWWFLIALIPVLGVILLLVFMLLDSQPGENQYGPNPKGVGGSSTNSSTNGATPTASTQTGFPTSTTASAPSEASTSTTTVSQ